MSNPVAADAAYPLPLKDVPPSWAVVYLADVIADIRNGYSSRRQERQTGDVIHLRPMNISRAGALALDHVEYALPRKGGEVLKGDVLFNNTNSRELVGKTALMTEDGNWAFSNHMTRLRFPPMIVPDFAAYQLHFLWLEGYSRTRCTQHVNQASISSRTLASTFPFILPPLAEQQRITDELKAQLKKIASARQTLEQATTKITRYINLILEKACMGTLSDEVSALLQPPAISEQNILESSSLLDQALETNLPMQPPTNDGSTQPYMRVSLPTGWRWSTVGEVGDTKLGRQLSPKYKTGKHPRPYLRVANVFEDRIDITDVHRMDFSASEYEIYRLRPGDILLNEGQSPDLVGRPALFTDQLPGACFQNTLIRFRAKPFIDPNFALLVFRFFLRSGVFRSIARWSTNIAHLGLLRLNSLPFPVPPLDQQLRIYAEMKSRLDNIANQRNVITAVQAKLDTLTKTLLNHAFSGQLSTRIPTDGTALEILNAIREWKMRPKSAIETKHTRPKKLVRENPTVSNARQLVEVLNESGGRLSPTELLTQSGYEEGNIDRFFKDLRAEIRQGHIRQVREGDTTVYLEVSS